MSLIHAIILGIIEGLTEFLPISSTAHLILVSQLLNIPQTDFQKFFEVFIQSGAILAVFFIYLKYVLKNKKIIPKVITSFVPTAVIGFLFYKIIKHVFFNSRLLMVFSFFILGVVFLVIEYLIKNKKIKLTQSIDRLSYQTAIIVGFMQALAVIPGVSRAGIVLVTMMILGFKREESARYSFLLAVPTILAASGYDLYKSKDLLVFSSNNLFLLMIGFVVSFISAYVVVNWFIKYLQKNTLNLFAIYRIILAGILFV
jgi:undecaprenyl-diphosphatase